MIFAKADAQSRELLQAEMKTATEPKWYRRLKIIDLSNQGYNVTELAEMFDLSAGTIRRYIHRYNTAGLTGLHPDYGRGRPPVLTWSQAEWLDVLAQSPADLTQLYGRPELEPGTSARIPEAVSSTNGHTGDHLEGVASSGYSLATGQATRALSGPALGCQTPTS